MVRGVKECEEWSYEFLIRRHGTSRSLFYPAPAQPEWPTNSSQRYSAEESTVGFPQHYSRSSPYPALLEYPTKRNYSLTRSKILWLSTQLILWTAEKLLCSASLCSSSDTFFHGSNGYFLWGYHIIRLFEFTDTLFIVSVTPFCDHTTCGPQHPCASSRKIFFLCLFLAVHLVDFLSCSNTS